MLAIKNATVFDGNGNTLDAQTILIEDGKFKQIDGDLNIPDNYEVIDAGGKIITPGLIDVHSHLGVVEEGIGSNGVDSNETSSATTPEVRALDAIDPTEVGFQDCRNEGITTVQVMPGSANVIGGEMVVMKTVGNIVDEMLLRSPSGMKAALGENPKNAHGSKGKPPKTRMGIAALLRSKLIEAQNYLNSDKKERNLGLENLVKVLNKEIPLRIHAHRANDIVTALRIKREFDIDMSLEHGTEGHEIAEFIAKHDVPVSVGPTMSSRNKVETKRKGWHTIKRLTDAGVSCSLTVDHPVIGVRFLRTSLVHAIREGLSEQEALKSITINAAKHLGVEDRVGSIEAGKDADFVIWNGNPFHLQDEVEAVYIDGQLVRDKTVQSDVDTIVF
ncbi:amidohydrolase [Ornithinibacillus sp. 4-3]|uniref:Amidohydrolase n=1 Tax=Ornithinibacillus sp. 4-3 TaxID=3231488 RepID=A0AB39HL05_9BACI